VDNHRKSIWGLEKAISCARCGAILDFQTQVDIAFVCCVVHNFLRGVNPNDHVMMEVD